MPDLLLTRERPLVMGVLNVTPDSFSDGGRFLDPTAALGHARRLVDDGADVVDIGGESTRPGADPVDTDEELRRVVPVIRSVVEETGVAVSVDTTKAEVARTALDAGAVMVNDVSAGRFDPPILGVAAAAGAHFVAMHMLGEPRTMQRDPRYDDVVDDVTSFLVERVSAALDAGVARDRIWVDPGIGFGKTVDHNLALLRSLGAIAERTAAPVIVGTSRKSFLGKVLADAGGGADGDDHGAEFERRDDATLATSVWAFEHGATMVRVHDVRSTARAVRLLDAVRRATPDGLADRALGANGRWVAA